MLVIVAIAAAVVAASCQRDTTGDQREPPAIEPARAAGDSLAPRAAPPPSVELLSAGAQPRRELRYQLAEGARERIVIELEMEMAMALGGAPSSPVKLPRMQMVLDLEVEEALDDGARYRFELSEARSLDSHGVDPTVLHAIEQGLSQTVGTRGRAVVDARGFHRDTRIDIPDDAPAETRQMIEATAQQMEQLASPLPLEPVGEGARWEVTQHLEQNGISLVQTSVITLASLDGDRGRIEATIRQQAPEQLVEMPGAMAGARAELIELRSRGDGTTEFDLTRLMPLRGEMRSESESRFQIDVGSGEPQPMSMQMELAVTLEGLEGS